MILQCEHKGYKLVQTEYNFHYMIFDKNGHRVLHAQCNKPLTEEKAKECIENYILLASKFDEIADDLEEEECYSK